MNFKKIYEANNKYYKFNIEWNTGDMYWDNIPDSEYFYGTIEELVDYLENSDGGIPDEFEKSVLSGDTIYDSGEETWSVNLIKSISYEEYKQYKEEEAEIERMRQEDEKESARSWSEDYWHSEEEAINGVKNLIKLDNISLPAPTKAHPDRVIHYDGCGLYTKKEYKYKYGVYWVVEISVEKRLSQYRNIDADEMETINTEIKAPKPYAEIYYTWTDQLKRGSKERHKTLADAQNPYQSFEIGKDSINKYLRNK